MPQAGARAAAPARAGAEPVRTRNRPNPHNPHNPHKPPRATNPTRFRDVSVATLVRLASTDHHLPVDVETTMTVAIVLVGIGAVATGALGIWLPAGERLAAGLALVVGAGIGVVAIAIGTRLVGDSLESNVNVLLVASALGLVGTLASLTVLWRRTTRERAAVSAPAQES
jgi:hypothetical protein